jgi:hypothetical protein
MTDDGHGVPDSDPDVIDPVGDLADLLESGDHDIQLADDQDPAELREFIAAVENGDFGEIDAALEGQVRVMRAILDDEPDD